MLKCVSSILLLVALYSNAAAGVIYVEDCVIKANDVTDEVSFYVEFNRRPNLWQPNAFNAFTIDILDSGQQIASSNLDVQTLSGYRDLRFILPLSEINQDDTFTYLISSYNGGEIGNSMYGEAIPVPEPHSIALTILGILFIVTVIYGRDAT